MDSLTDIGANLTDKQFDQDRHQVIADAFSAGVKTLIITGSDEIHSQAASHLACQYPGQLFATSGVHPHYAKHCSNTTLDHLKQIAQHENVLAIGECGLDYFRDISPRDVQKKWFEAQLELAIELKLPVFLHQREAHSDFMQILSHYQPHLRRILVHCFTGTVNELDDYLSLDCYIGITGWICDERRGAHLAELVALIPAQRLLIETDAPYLLPRDLNPKPKSRRNEPKHLPHICQTIAHHRSESMEELAHSSTRAAYDFFQIT